VALEEEIKRQLDLEEYSPNFIRWAKKFLGDMFEETIRNEGSITKVCGKSLDTKAWIGRIKKYRQRHDARTLPHRDETADKSSSSGLSSSDIQY
jgi:hypothetical protein